VSAPPVERPPIQVLPPRAAERIAAGEVIERPASVVKELLENALDAGARRVRVEVCGSGLRLVRVVDDGCGIPADQIGLAFQRHATSKIRGVDDLDRLATLGFRGEALPSIGAVAEVVVLTAADDGGLGHEALVRAGQVVDLVPRPRARGTSVSVRYLFQTVPARLKFVANARQETAAIGALVRRYALAYPMVRFALLLDGRVAMRTSGDGIAATLADVFGAAVAEALAPLPPLEAAGARWHGYLSQRHVTRPHRGGITLIVNGRWVEVRELLGALEAAYRPLLPRGRHPIALLRCDLPANALDVNVHPAKTEIKFLHGPAMAQALATWVREALGRGAAQLPGTLDLRLGAGTDLCTPLAAGDPTAAREAEPALGSDWLADPLAWRQLDHLDPTAMEGDSPAPPLLPSVMPAPHSLAYQQDAPRARWYRIAEDRPTDDERPPAAGPPGEASAAVPAGSLPPLQFLGQVQDALLLCEGPAGLYLVDQHRAHERVLYEELRARHTPVLDAPVEPIVLEVRPAQAARLAARLPALAALGFVCEWFGGRSFLVRATPRLVGGPEAGEAAFGAVASLADALDRLLDEAAAEDDDWQDRLLISVACRGALRRGQPLPIATMTALLAALDRSDAPAVCPHGSPLILHLSDAFLARQFRWR
jgi:DNA mismatch repair protein MutL